MTQQGKRIARLRQWAGTTTGTYNEAVQSAGQAAGGWPKRTTNEQERYIHRAITGSAGSELAGLRAETATYLDVTGGWDSVGDELPIAGWSFVDGGSFPGLNYGTQFRGATTRDGLVYVDAGNARTSKNGLLVEPQVTNKCINTNLKPVNTNGSVSIGPVTDYKAVAVDPPGGLPNAVYDGLKAIDPQGNVTGVFRLEGSGSGAGVSIQGTTGNTNVHTASMWVYVISGTWRLRMTNEPTATTITAGAWGRYEFTETPNSDTEQAVLESTGGGGECWWFGNQLEEQPSRTSLVEIDQSAATRLGDNVFTALPSGFSNASFIVAPEFNFYRLPPTNALGRVVQLDNLGSGGGTYVYSMVRHTADRHYLSDDNLLNLDTGIAYTADTVSKEAWGMDSGNIRIAVDGTAVAPVAYTPPVLTQVRFGANVGSQQQVGGYIRRVALYDLPATQANVEKYST